MLKRRPLATGKNSQAKIFLNVDSEIYGGDPEFTDFVLSGGEQSAVATLFNSWKASLTTNPITIRFEVWKIDSFSKISID